MIFIYICDPQPVITIVKSKHNSSYFTMSPCLLSLSQPGCESQLACLLSLKLPYLHSTLELFVQWVQDGIYDFHHLPLVMKKHLEDGDVETLQKIIVNYKSKYLCM